MKHTCTLLLMIVSFFTTILAQPQNKGSQISGKVIDITQTPVPYATVLLLKNADSIVLRTTLSDSTGLFEFTNITAGHYLLKVSTSGYKDVISKQITVDEGTDNVSADITGLEPSATELGNVTVVARRPMIEVQADKTILNVEAAITNGGATALEVLEKSPGLSVDRDGNITFKGKPNPLVLIDGKPTYLSPADLVNLLTSMNANQLDQIELMSNPPAKYDAAGNAGVINIKTKKGKQKGFNGSVNLAYTQGRYANTSNSLNLNYRNNKFNVFANYSINKMQNFNDLNIKRAYFEPDETTVWKNFEQPTYLKIEGHNNTIKLGADYYLNKKTTLGIVTGGFISPRGFKGTSEGYWMNADFEKDSSTVTTSDNHNRWQSGNINLNLRHEIDKTSEITADVDFVRYDMDNNQLFTNENYDKNGTLIYADQIRGKLPASINIFSAKTDYTTALKSNWKLDAGLKTSHVTTDNLASYDNRVLPNGVWTPDYEISNHFTYEERIQAAYGNIKGGKGKWEYEAGLRLEHTGYEGYQAGNPIKDDSSFSRNYTSLFPTGFVSWKVDSLHTLSFNTGRRIQRPAYQQLNPFKFFINEYTYQEGNPYLQPQLTTNFELTYSYKGKINTTIGYAQTNQVFSQVFIPEGPVTIVTEGNLGTRKNFNVTFNINHEPAKWWTLSVSGTGNYLVMDGEWLGQKIESSAFNWSANMNNQFRFNKGWSAELSGNYNSNSEDGQFTIQGFGQVSAGIGKQILKTRGTLRLNVRDIFWTQKIDGQIKYGEVREHFYQFRDSRQATISFQYRFGKSIKDGERKRRNTGGASEEQSRVRIG